LGINDTNFDDNSGSYTVTIAESTDTATQEPTVISKATPTTTLTQTPTVTSKATPTAALTQTPTSTLSLRHFAQVRGIQIGAAVAAEPLRDEALYAETLAREFNMLTPENVMKFGPLRPSRDRYDFDKADAIVDFAEAHAMQVRGHVLVWHQQLPSWLTEGNWARDELIEILHEHIATVVGRYRGRIMAWDVVNEAVAGNGSLADTIWLRGIGPDYIDMAFHWAHEADPDARLFYNDYGGEGLGDKSEAIYALVHDLLQRGVPIHGVGLQMHVSVDQPRDPQDVTANMNRLSALGLEVHITEMDVMIKDPATENDLAKQARIYRDMLRVCLSAQNCKAFVLWGFTDHYSWIPGFNRGWDAALIFDKSYRPKPAYYALLDELASVGGDGSSEQ
jgi:endo-1,4-beta-xylanase